MGNQFEALEGLRENAELILEMIQRAFETGKELTVRLTSHFFNSMPKR